MNRIWKIALVLLSLAMLLGGCTMKTVDELYAPPKRSPEYRDLQNAIDRAMAGLDYCAPLTGENQQTVQMADLDGEGTAEYLLFARGGEEKSLQILIFSRTEDGCVLRENILCPGSGFEQVEYVDIDGQPGMELVVGRRVSDQVMRSLSVYSFAGGSSVQLMTANYYKFVTCDLDMNGLADLLTITPGTSEEDHAAAMLYSFHEGEMLRSREASLSESAENIKRIMTGNLHGEIPAVYVASTVEESAIITDVFALKNGRFTNVSLSNESGTSVQTMRNYYIYADDIDNDGVLELPSLMSMVRSVDTQQHLIRWYAMDIGGREVDKMFTFHNFAGGWYLQLDEAWASRVAMVQDGNAYIFSLWNATFDETEKIMTVYVLSGSDREKAAAEEGRFLLYRGAEVIYAAELAEAAESWGITQESLANSFRLIYQEWKTGETE